MKKYSVLALVVVLALSLFACKELEVLKSKFIQSGPYFGLGAYVNKILYIAIDDVDKDSWMFVDRWDAFDGNHTIYYLEQQDESLAGLKYIKRTGIQMPIGWSDESGMMVINNPFLYAYEEISGRKWKKEVREIGMILLKDPMGIIEAQSLLARDLGYLGDNI